MSLLPVKKYPPAGKQGCKPQERGAAPALGGSQPIARDQLNSCLQLPGNSCDGCAQDIARAGPPRAGAPDAGLRRVSATAATRADSGWEGPSEQEAQRAQ